MKRIVFVLLLIIPCFCWGQAKVSDRIEVSDEMKRVPSQKLTIEIVKLNIFYNQNTWNGRIVDAPTPRNVKYTFIVDGIVVDDYNISNTKIEDIESISVLKESWQKEIFCNPPTNVILITTKPKEEYEVIVFDPGYESFLATQKSKEFYSEATLKVKNTQMVIEWNSRHHQPLRYNPDIYEVSIDYDPKIDYGLEVEYQLYMFFRFMEKENGISLIGDYYAANI